MAAANITSQRLAKRAQALKDRMNTEEKCALATEMGNALTHDTLSDIEKSIALEIIEKLIADEIEAVRCAAAESVAGSPHLPSAVAQKLAEDIKSVAIPVLKLSPVLEERFLAKIIEGGVVEKINAIAEREDLSENLAHKIVASGKTNSVIKLLNNKTSKITDQTVVTIIRVYGDHHKIEQALFDRDCLNNEIMDVLKKLTEAHVATFIKRYFNLPEKTVDIEKGRKLQERNQKNDDSNWWDTKKGAV